MPFVDNGIELDSEKKKEDEQKSTGKFVDGGISVDRTPEDIYKHIVEYENALTDLKPTQDEFKKAEKYKSELPLTERYLGKTPLASLGTGIVETGKAIANIVPQTGEFIGEVAGTGSVDAGAGGEKLASTLSESAMRAGERGKSMLMGLADTVLDLYDKTQEKGVWSETNDYQRYLARSEVKRNLAMAESGRIESIDADTLKTLGMSPKSISKAGVEALSIPTDPSTLAFAGGGKMLGMALQGAMKYAPAASQAAGRALQSTGRGITSVAETPERMAGSAAATITGSEAAGEAVRNAVASGSAIIGGTEVAGVPISGIGTLPRVVGSTIAGGKLAGGAASATGEAMVAGGETGVLSPIQQGLLNVGERIAASPTASAAAKSVGYVLSKTGAENAIRTASKIMIPAVGGGIGGGALAVATGEEGDKISEMIGGGMAFGGIEKGFGIAKATATGAIDGPRVRKTALEDLNSRPNTIQFTYIDPVTKGEKVIALNDLESRKNFYNRLSNVQLLKVLSEISNAEANNVDVIFHDSKSSVPPEWGTYKGVSIDPESIKNGKPTILVNTDIASVETLPHEITHAKITAEFINAISSNILEGKIDKAQIESFVQEYASKIESSGNKSVADQMRDSLFQAFNDSNNRTQKIEALKRIGNEFAAYYTQEWLAGKDPKKLLKGRIPSLFEDAWNNAKEAISARFSSRALQDGFDPIARTFYDANGKRIKIDWMEDAIDKLIAKDKGFEGTERKIKINNLSRAEREALIQSKGWSDLFMLAPDGSIVRALSPSEVASKTAGIANRVIALIDAMSPAERRTVSQLDEKGNPVISGRLSLQEAAAIGQSGIFSASTSRFLIDMAKSMADGRLFESKYWKVYGKSGKAGVFGESTKMILPYGIEINRTGGVNIRIVDWSKVQARLQSALSKPQYKNLFRNYSEAMSALTDIYLKNIAEQNAVPSADALGGGLEGSKKRNFFNEVMGAVPKIGDVVINPHTVGYAPSRRGGSVYETIRVERIQDLVDSGKNVPWSGDMGEGSSYRRTQLNFQPAEKLPNGSVIADTKEGFKIVESNGKFKLFDKSGNRIGIYDTDGQAKLKAEKEYEKVAPDRSFMPADKDPLRVKMTREALTDAALSQSSWKDWYNEHQQTLNNFFGDYAELFQRILSVTSQRASVKANVSLALKAFGQLIRNDEFKGYLPSVIENLKRIQNEQALRGQKISSYEKANQGDKNSVVVDMHIARLLFGVDSPSKEQFAKASQILKEVADKIGWEPRQVQAALWAHSIVKSGKTPESYGAYLKKLESKNLINERIGGFGERSAVGDGLGGQRGRYSPNDARPVGQEVMFMPSVPEFKMSGQSKKAGDVEVLADVSKIEDSFKKSWQYIGEKGQGGIGKRYENFGKFLESKTPIEMPEIGIDDSGIVHFTNGRHRFSYLRDNGVKEIPVAVSKDNVYQFAEKFASKNDINFMPADYSKPLEEPDIIQKAGKISLPKTTPEKGYFTVQMGKTEDGRDIQYKLDPTRTIEPTVKSIDSIAGERVAMLEADRHDTLGENMAGPLHPELISNQVVARLPDGRGYKAVWANMNRAFVTRCYNIIKNTTAGHALVQIMKEEAHKSNRKFVSDVMKVADEMKSSLKPYEVDALHVILEYGASNPANKLKLLTKAKKAFEEGKITAHELKQAEIKHEEILIDIAPKMKFLEGLSKIKSSATRGKVENAKAAFKELVDKYKNYPWFKAIVKKYKDVSFSDEAKRFTFNQRGGAMTRIKGLPTAPNVGKMLADSMDFNGGKNLDIVRVIQLSKDKDAFAIYLGEDPKQEAKMSKNERYLRDEFLKNPNFKKHQSYDWIMLGPENADNFILDKPQNPLSLFPDYAKKHPKESVREGTPETIVGTMRKAKIPLILK